MRYLTLCLLLCFSFGLKAQKIYDKEAEALLSRVSATIKSHEQIAADFSFITDYPGSEVEPQKGQMIQSGNAYKVSIGENEILSTQEAFYLIDKSATSVQINDPLDNSATDIYNPISLMEKYDSGEFEFAIVGEEKIDSKRCYLVEFKPTDRYSELSKIRVAIDATRELPVYIKIFNKDASNITIDIEKMELVKEGGVVISFKKSNYEGYVVEDLRID